VPPTLPGRDDEHGAVGLRSSGDHVLDEVAVSRGVDDRHVVVLRLELPEGDVDRDSALALCLQLVQNPSIFEGAFAHLKGKISLWEHHWRMARGACGLPKVLLGLANRHAVGRPLKRPYGRFRGGPPAGQVVYGYLLPFRLCRALTLS
jgi:hypothetical protein